MTRSYGYMDLDDRNSDPDFFMFVSEDDWVGIEYRSVAIFSLMLPRYREFSFG